MAELADASGLSPDAFGHEGSTPFARTKMNKLKTRKYKTRICINCQNVENIRIEILGLICSICIKKEREKLRTERICQTCFKIFRMRKSDLPPINKTTNARGNFCSLRCYHRHLRS